MRKVYDEEKMGGGLVHDEKRRRVYEEEKQAGELVHKEERRLMSWSMRKRLGLGSQMYGVEI
jgi:hypothetical protein